jgi:hypothetical protein
MIRDQETGSSERLEERVLDCFVTPKVPKLKTAFPAISPRRYASGTTERRSNQLLTLSGFRRSGCA